MAAETKRMEVPQIVTPNDNSNERFEVQQLTAVEFVTLLEASEVFKRDDTGDLTISNCSHPTRGHTVLVEGISGSYFSIQQLTSCEVLK